MNDLAKETITMANKILDSFLVSETAGVIKNFVIPVKEFCEEKGYCSFKQRDGMKNIYEDMLRQEKHSLTRIDGAELKNWGCQG